MKIIVVGCGKIGSTLVEELAEDGHDITVIDTRPEKLNQLSSYLDVYGVEGSGASYQTQVEAGVKTADMLIATTAADEVNLLCCLIAKQVGVQNIIARVRTPYYMDDIRFFRDEMGLSLAISPELVTAQEISRHIRFPSAINVETFNKGRVELIQVRIPEKCKMDGKALEEITYLRKSGVLICMVERNGEVVIPNGKFVLRSGDDITVVVPPGKTGEFFAYLGLKNNTIESVIIAGGGRISYYLAHILLDEGMDVKIIEKNPARAMELCELLPGATIIQGDCTDKKLLAEEGVDNAQCFVSLTDMDEENVMLSLYVGTRSKAKLITKINHVTFDEVINHLPLGSVIYSKNVVVELLAQYVRATQNSVGSNVETLHILGDGAAEALEFHVRANSPLVGVPLQELNIKPNLLVCSITHQGTSIIPRGRDAMHAGDSVIIVTTNTGLNDLSDILA